MLSLLLPKEKFHQRLLVINQYYFPDFASTGLYAADICSGLVKEDIEVHVVTSQPSYTSSSPTAPSYEILNGVHVYRVSLGKIRGRENMKIRVSGYIRFLHGAWKMARNLIKSKKFHSVLTFHNPPFVGLLGAYLARSYALRFIYILYDIHPDILLATGWRLPKLFFKLWELVNKWIFKHAHTVIVLSEGMKETLIKKGVPFEKIHVIPLWGRPEFREPLKVQSNLQELRIKKKRLMLLYAGNMGTLHNLDHILDTTPLMRGESVHFIFVGEGIRKKYLIYAVQNENLENITILPYQLEDRFIEILSHSDACFITLGPGLEKFAFPSRAYTFLSAGKPLITIMSPEADIARLVIETECGWNVTTAQELSNLLRYLLENPQELVHRGKRAREVYLERFQKELIIGEYARVMGKIYSDNVHFSIK